MIMDYLWGLVGGVLIGLAGASYLLVNGRVMGASGILGELVDGSARGGAMERSSFLAGLVLIPAAIALVYGYRDTQATTNPAILVAAGLLVGLGTRIAGGCTSGHGVCGISRLSARGIVATIIYICAGGVMLGLARHGLGWF